MGLMKKLTSVVVTAGLLLGLVGTAFAAYPADSAASAKRMQDLGIIQGDAGGLRLGDSITRAELIKVIVWAYGKGNDAKFLKGAPAFPDTANHWASGEIALAKNMIEANGFKLGRPDGTFGPQDNVTAAEAVAMVMKFLGAPADASQAWPNDYLNGAVAAGILTADDKATVAGVANAPATRGLVFYLADTAFASYKLSTGKTVYTQYVRPTAPTLTVDEVAPTTDSSVTVTGSVSSVYTDPFVVTVGSSTNVATVSGGKFTATVSDLAMGDNNISVMVTDEAGNVVTKTVKVTRTAGAAAKIDAPATLTVDAGASADLAIAVKDAKGNAVSGVTPTVTSDLGSFADGKFTAGQKSGTGTISIAAGDLTASVAVTVNPGAVAKLVLDPATVDLSAGGSQKFAVSGQDAFGNAVAVKAGDVTWTASKGIIGQDGSFGATTDATGTVTVTATAGTVSGTATVTVFGVATKITAAAPSNLVANGKSTGDLVITVLDANGNVAKNFSGTLSLVNNSTNVVKALTSSSVAAVNGVATITLTAGSSSGTAAISISGTGLTGYVAPVTVSKQTPTSVSVTIDPPTLAADNASNAKLNAVLLDQTGYPVLNSSYSGQYSLDFVVSDTNVVDGRNSNLLSQSLTYNAGSDGVNKIQLAQNSLPYVTAKNALGSVTITPTVKYNNVASTTVTANSVSVSTAVVGSPYKLTIDPLTDAKTANTDSTGSSDQQKVVVRVVDVNGNQVTSDSASTIVLQITGDNAADATQSAGSLSGGKKTFTVDCTDVGTLNYTVTGTWNANTLVQATATGNFVAGPADHLSLSASPSTIAANGTGTSVLKAKVVDLNGNTVTAGSYSVKFTRQSGGNAIANWADQTISTVNGIAQVTVTGTNNLASDTFRASTTINGNTVNSTSDATISTRILGTANQLSFAAYSSGYVPYNSTSGNEAYTGGKAGEAQDVYVAIQDANALANDGSVDTSGGNYHRNIVTYDNSTVVNLTATDTSDVTTTYTATAANGIAHFVVTLNTADSYTLKASAANLKSADGEAGNNPSASLAIGAGDATGLKISSNTPTLGADGSSATLKITMVDSYGNAVDSGSAGDVSGLQVSSSSTGVVTLGSATYYTAVDASSGSQGGTASSSSKSATLSATSTSTPGSTTITATKSGLTSATYSLSTAVVGSVARVSVAVNDSYTVTATPSQKITVTLLDANGNRVTNVPSGYYVKLTKNSSASAVIYSSTGTTLANSIQQALSANAGAVTFKVADTVAENVTYTAQLVDADSASPNPIANTQTSTAVGTFTAGSASKVDIAVSPDSSNDNGDTVISNVYGDGSNVVVLTISVTDSYGNAVSSATGSVKVNLSAASAAVAYIQGADSAGYYTTTISNGQAIVLIQTRNVFAAGNVSVTVQYSKDGTFASPWTLSGSQGHNGSNIIHVAVPSANQ